MRSKKTLGEAWLLIGLFALPTASFGEELQIKKSNTFNLPRLESAGRPTIQIQPNYLDVSKFLQVLPKVIEDFYTYVSDVNQSYYRSNFEISGPVGFNKMDFVIKAFKDAGYSVSNTADLHKLVENRQFPPEEPTLQFLKVLRNLDFDLFWHLQGIWGYAGKNDSYSSAYAKLTNERLVSDLQYLYPSSIVTTGLNTKDSGAFYFDGDKFNWSSSAEGNFFETLVKVAP
jgi:hypothetical protein